MRAEMKLGFHNENPTTRPSASILERFGDERTQPVRRSAVARRRPWLGNELPEDDLRDKIVRHGGEIGIGRGRGRGARHVEPPSLASEAVSITSPIPGASPGSL